MYGMKPAMAGLLMSIASGTGLLSPVVGTMMQKI